MTAGGDGPAAPAPRTGAVLCYLTAAGIVAGGGMVVVLFFGMAHHFGGVGPGEVAVGSIGAGLVLGLAAAVVAVGRALARGSATAWRVAAVGVVPLAAGHLWLSLELDQGSLVWQAAPLAAVPLYALLAVHLWRHRRAYRGGSGDASAGATNSQS